jgi:hypothetical protein
LSSWCCPVDGNADNGLFDKQKTIQNRLPETFLFVKSQNSILMLGGGQNAMAITVCEAILISMYHRPGKVFKL